MKPLLSRVIFHVDEETKVMRITYEPAALASVHQRAANAANNLIVQCAEFFGFLRYWQAPTMQDSRWLDGYRHAMREMQELHEIQRIRDAIADARLPLRDSAQSALGGIEIPRVEMVPAFILDEVR